MNETKFTKGPLGVEGPATPSKSDPTCGGDYAICDTSGLIIGEAWSLTGDRPARENALLWAAAPEMYEALVEAIKELNDCAIAEHGEPYNNPRFNAILAKARGES